MVKISFRQGEIFMGVCCQMICHSGGSPQSGYIPKEMEPFFEGQVMVDRMKRIREEFIEPVRKEYSRDLFNSNIIILKQQFQGNSLLNQLIDQISYSYWNDQINQTKQFNFIRLLTLEEGSKTIGRLISNVLREQSLPSNQLVRLVVFLIEAVNIELFLLTQQRPKLQGYQGKVYRGFVCHKQDFQKFKKVMDKSSWQDRVISVPLSLWSSSKNLLIAESLINLRRRELSNPTDFANVVLSVQVINLEQQSLAEYRKEFPSSVVSTICAVDISDPSLSYHPSQKEVLLRGAFCLVLDILEEEKSSNIEGLIYHRIDCVMVNANRDHISTNHLGEQSQSARNLFANINKKARYIYARQYFKENRNRYNELDFIKKESFFQTKENETTQNYEAMVRQIILQRQKAFGQ